MSLLHRVNPLRSYERNSMRIAIITFHRAYNCGAMLQAWALKTVLERMGHNVFFPFGDYNRVVPRYPVRSPLADRCRSGSRFKRLRSLLYRLVLTAIGKKSGVTAGVYYEEFRRQFLPEISCDVQDWKNYFDAVVLGSDQVLNPNIQNWTSYFLCTGIPEGIRKIAYAASIGEKPLPSKVEAEILNALASFSAVSVREPFKDFPVVLDPSLLLTSNDYNTIAKTLCRRREYIYLYSVETSPFEIAVARQIAERLDLELVITPLHGTFHHKKERGISNRISPSYMVGHIKKAKYILAGSFHGTAIALVHGKPFLNILPDHRAARRVSTLLEHIGETDRIVNSDISIDEMILRLTRPLDEKCLLYLDEVRHESLEWLETALTEIKK